ncbi:hypothetical protein J5U18_01050 [Sphingobacteriaceae bacterium WQ 2009]|uniref:Phosphoenolpyruvate carboxykinase n=1 Tax=Rhinopithecimicrobium faecis TaxID=2820698 RepID=A0A8T4H744_9SPHI|nr:hypothetical protein [Sphingobacteriaceae bacterium WQ 2009]
MPDNIQKLLNTKICYYNIAGLILELEYPKDIKIDTILPNFKDFSTLNVENKKTTCSICLYDKEPATVQDLGKILSNVSIVWGDQFRFYENDLHYITTIDSGDNLIPWKMVSKKDFSESKVYINTKELYTSSVLSWLIMVAFAQTSLLHKTILIHASTVEYNKEGYAFLGKSGTGKSTHSRLWLETFVGSRLLNDDNPAVRIHADNSIYIYGTPWSGKTPCYINRGVPLRALVRLQQAPENKFHWKTGMEAFIQILPSCSSIRWNKKLFNSMSNTTEELVKNLKIGYLQCLPNQDAAILCYNQINNYK